ncbi:MAG: RimK/LysX family protein [Gemmatimonadota bacterium]|nr:RimK/LysX family protein [Gemmatimonadota bacterium]
MELNRNRQSTGDGLRICGWREWASLPSLGIDSIKVKLDTGARTSVLHAWDIETYADRGRQWVRFRVFPAQRNKKRFVCCESLIADRRWVTNSGGSRERRFVISTDLNMGRDTWPIELTLTNRDEMGFRMLIGREAMQGRLVVDPDVSYTIGRPARKKARTKTQREVEKEERAQG